MRVFFMGLIILLLLFMFVPLGVRIYNQYQNGPCILLTPIGEAKKGRIYSDGSLFGSGNMVYDLCYPGTYQRSRKKCSYWISVTEGEYERQMYGVKR